MSHKVSRNTALFIIYHCPISSYPACTCWRALPLLVEAGIFLEQAHRQRGAFGGISPAVLGAASSVRGDIPCGWYSLPPRVARVLPKVAEWWLQACPGIQATEINPPREKGNFRGQTVLYQSIYDKLKSKSDTPPLQSLLLSPKFVFPRHHPKLPGMSMTALPRVAGDR